MPSANPKSGWTGTASRAADGRRRIAGDGVGSQELQSDDGGEEDEIAEEGGLQQRTVEHSSCSPTQNLLPCLEQWPQAA